MTFWTYLDGLPLGPVALFGLGYLALLLVVLAWLRTRRIEERCDRCGDTWRRTERGNAFHVCVQRELEWP